MFVRYLPANMAYVVVLSLRPDSSPLAIGPDNRRFYNSRDELEAVLRSVGLKSDVDGNVTLANGARSILALGNDKEGA